MLNKIDLKAKDNTKLFQIISLFLLCLFFYVLIFDLGNITGDEWISIENHVSGLGGLLSMYTEDFPFLLRAHCFYSPISYAIIFFQLEGGLTLFRIFNFVGVVFAVYAAYRFVKRLASKETALAYSLLFGLFIQIFDTNYSGFVSFCADYQMKMALVFLSMEQLLKYFEDKKTSHLWFCGIWFLVACSSYECFIFACVPLLFIAIEKLKQEDRLNFKNLFKTLIIPASFGVFYLVLYYFCRQISASEYDGTRLVTSFDVFGFLETIIVTAFADIPMRHTFLLEAGEFKNVLSSMFSFSWTAIAVWVGSAFISVVLVRTLYRTKAPKFRTALTLIVMCILTSIGFAIPQSLTGKYINHVTTDYLKVPGTSYYAYFFLILALLLILQLIIKKFDRLKKYIAPFLAVILTVASCLTYHSNLFYKNSYNSQYYSFITAANSDYFKEHVKDGSTIFTLDFRGFFSNTEYIRTIVKEATGCDVKVVAMSSSLDIIDNTEGNIFVKHNWQSGAIVMYQMTDKRYGTDVYLNIPKYSEDLKLTVEYGDDFLESESFLLDGALHENMQSLTVDQTEWGGYEFVFTSNEPYMFTYTAML